MPQALARPQVCPATWDRLRTAVHLRAGLPGKSVTSQGGHQDHLLLLWPWKAWPTVINKISKPFQKGRKRMGAS